MKVLVLGGTGVISSCIVNTLIKRNDSVTIINRGKTVAENRNGITLLIADRKDRETFEAACTSDIYDAVIDMICFDLDDAKQTVALFKDRTKQIIICSTIAAYKRPYCTLPVEEDSESLMDSPLFPYSFHKANMERYLREEQQQKGVPITIVRPSQTFGKGSRNIGTFRQNYTIVERMKTNKPLVVFGDGHNPWTYSFAPDVANAIVSLIGVRGSLGESFHVTSEEKVIFEDLYLEFGKLIGVEPKFVYVPAKTLFMANPNLCAHIYFEKSFAGVFSNDKRHSVVGRKIPCEYNLATGVKLVYESWVEDGLCANKELDLYEDAWVKKILAFEDSVKDLK
jgi:nucleoside-diphosphate-sugar epimerase